METQQKLPFTLHKKNVVLVKPSKPTPLEILSFSSIDNDPNLQLMCRTLYAYQANDVSSNGINSARRDPGDVIKEALSKVLVYYYPLAGKLKRKSDGKLQIDCNEDGVPFLEANIEDGDLSSLHYLDRIDVEIAKQFSFGYKVPETEALAEDANIGYHPLVFQVTKFSCGGFVIGMEMSHSVVDGFGAAQFFRALVEIASGKSEPSLKPVWERERLVGHLTNVPFKSPHDKDFLATSPYLPTTDLVHECFNVDGNSIKRLKARMMKETRDDNLKESFTTFDILSAYVWRSRVRALKLNPDKSTLLGFAIGIRRIMDPPLPEGYYGNAFVSSNIMLKSKELDEEPLLKAVRLINESKKAPYEKDYISNMLGTLEKIRELDLKFDTGIGGVTIITDWRQLRLLEDVDFGWKGSVNIIPLPWNIFEFVDLCMFLPSCKLDLSMKDGVRVFVYLPRTAMSRFKEEMDSLRLGEDDDAPVLTLCKE